MSTDRSAGPRSATIDRWLTAFLAALGGFAFAGLLFLDPLGLHPLDERLAGRAESPEPAPAAARLWTCGMHPQVLQSEPGQCPICQMELVPVGSDAAHGAHAEEVWTCPLHPEIHEPGPGKCPICGSELVRHQPEHGAAGISLDPAVVQAMNVRTAPVERRDLRPQVRAVGSLELDPERLVTVTTKYPGWVEKVYVNYVGQKVRRGEPLFEVYSPELVQTQKELLSALELARRLAAAPEDAHHRAWSLVGAGRTRLGYWDVAPEQIEKLEQTGEVFRTLRVFSPIDGVVIERLEGLEGMAIEPGRAVYQLADLRQMWVAVDVFEDQLAEVREGTEAAISLSYFPGETFRGRVRFLEPELAAATRTLKVKIAVPNHDGRLRVGMFASVVFEPAAQRAVLAVPVEAVVRTGTRNLVLVDLGGGRFLPREVTLGRADRSNVEVLAGVAEGEQVATSSQFLLDAESNLREAIARMLAAQPAGVSVGGPEALPAGHVH